MNKPLFSEISGHSKVKDVLMCCANSNRVGHAYIFEGPKGVGKQTMAKAFAARLMCNNPKDGDACGECSACSRCASFNHPDVQIVTNQLYDSSKKSTDILVDTVRNMKKDIYIKPYSADRKVYIVPNADTMNVYAQNSLLKVLEEPPEYCTIILLAENSNSFLPTILSRSTLIRFFPLSTDEVSGHLKKCGEECAAEQIEVAARLCGGSIGRAKELLEDSMTNDIRCALIDNITSLLGSHRKSIYDLCLFLKQNKTEAKLLLGFMEKLFVDMLYIKTSGSTDNITNIDKKVKIQKFTDSLRDECPARLCEILFKYSDYIDRNISYGLISQALSLELWEAINDRGCRSKI